MTLLKVKRDGPRGWHLIDAGRFDPLRHELWQEPQEQAGQASQSLTDAQIVPADLPKRKKGRTK